jgi:hypothetical protein
MFLNKGLVLCSTFRVSDASAPGLQEALEAVTRARAHQLRLQLLYNERYLQRVSLQDDTIKSESSAGVASAG